MTKQKSLFLIVFFLSVPLVFSIPLENLVTPGIIARLRSGNNFIYETNFSGLTPEFMPANNEFRQFITGVMNSINNNITVEALYLYDKPERSRTSSQTWDSAQKTRLFNQLLAVSTLEGLQYYSASRGEMRTFFEYSRVIDQPNARNPPPLPDPYFFVPPESYSLYARQRDLTFGDNVYHYDYKTSNDGVFFVQENVSALTLGIIPAVGKGNLKMVLAIFDCGDTLLIYTVSFVRAVTVSSLRERIGVSFANRAEAIINWFTAAADRIL